jgi:hypothetical protein
MGTESNEAYQRSLDVHRAIEALYPRIEQHRAFFRVLTPVDRQLPQLPGKTGGTRIDPVVCALSIKAATTKRAILALCELGDGENALALTRVLLENACLLEWLTRGVGRRRLEAYVMFTSVQHERIAATVERHKARCTADGAAVDVLPDPYHQAVWEHVFRDERGRRTKSDRPTWEFDCTGTGTPVSVRGVFQEITEAKNSFEHDILYGALGSAIVHSGPFSLLSIQRMMSDAETFVLRSIPIPDLCTIALASSNTAMFLVLDSLTEYLGLDLSNELGKLKADLNVAPSGPQHVNEIR